MSFRTEETAADRVERISVPRYTRILILLVALCCLSIGVAIGAIARGVVGAKSDDNRLSISQSTASPDSLSAIFARVSAQVEPAVVNIKISEGEDRAVFSREGTGSGVIVNASGYIITNQHVVGRASKITVKLADGREFKARVIGEDAETDLAVIKIDPSEPLPAAKMGDSDRLNVGDWVLAIGSPFGYEQTVTAGIISAKERIIAQGSSAFQQFLQTDAAINPGNSGGPLVNLQGEVVGINTQIATTSGVFNGIGFALPSSTGVDVYNQIITDGRVRRGYLGIYPAVVPPQISRLNKIPEGQGVLVIDLAGEASPAARAGIEIGDIILSINGQSVTTPRELIRKIAALPVGSLANIVAVRKGEQRTAAVRLEERKDESKKPINTRQRPFDPRNPQETPEGDSERSEKPRLKPGLGLTVKSLLPELARLKGLEGVRGAYISNVIPGSVSDENGIEVDDVIIEINQKPVLSLEDYTRMTRDLKTGDDMVLRVIRKDRGPLRRSLIISFTMP
ncbi:MAG TPA: trypsin-like peptidase domain-containing protein [Blastocatellia bacterium]|jgi:serine protease Do|nr:trypsin-like peptidase domain-containing protein [Blastocatellia bacterium]